MFFIVGGIVKFWVVNVVIVGGWGKNDFLFAVIVLLLFFCWFVLFVNGCLFIYIFVLVIIFILLVVELVLGFLVVFCF